MLHRTNRISCAADAFLAILNPAFEEHFDTVEGLALIADENLKLIVFERKTEEIAQWIE